MQADNVYRPTEDTNGQHRQLLTALADAALQHAKGVMQQTSTAGQSCLFCPSWPCRSIETLGLLLWALMCLCSSEHVSMHGSPGDFVFWPRTCFIVCCSCLAPACLHVVTVVTSSGMPLCAAYCILWLWRWSRHANVNGSKQTQDACAQSWPVGSKRCYVANSTQQLNVSRRAYLNCA